MLEMILAYAHSFTANMAKREEGQAMVEYALILALVSVAAVLVLGPLGGAISGIFTSVTGSL